MEQLFKDMCNLYENRLNDLKAMRPHAKMLSQYNSEVLQWLDKMRKGADNKEEIFLNEIESLIKQDVSEIWRKAAWYGKLDEYLYLSLFYYHVALFAQLHHRSGEACMHLQNAQYYCGIWKGARDRLDWVTHSEKKQMEKTENTRKGGVKRSENMFGPAKNEAIRLLKANIPEGGWIERTEAFDSIEDELWSFIYAQRKEGEDPILAYEELQRTVLRWLFKDKNVKAAYEEGALS